MRTHFRQGLVSSDSTGFNQPAFLTNSDRGVTITTSTRSAVFTAAHGPKNYSIVIHGSELAIPAELTPNASVTYWMYVEIELTTGKQKFGVSETAPTYGTVCPGNPTNGQHWFDVNAGEMKVFDGRTWLTVIRVFLGTKLNSTVQPVPYGSQVGVNVPVLSGSILFDSFGHALRDSSGYFITTEEVILTESITHALTLESNVVAVIALEPIPAYHVVRRHAMQNGVKLACYNDVGDSVIGLTLAPADVGEPLSLVMSGRVYNPLWNWERPNMSLWVSAGGQLVTTDPYSVNPRTTRRSPVARTIDAHTVLFSQGLATITAETEHIGNMAADAKIIANQAYDKAHGASLTVTDLDRRLSVVEGNGTVGDEALNAVIADVASNTSNITTINTQMQTLSSSIEVVRTAGDLVNTRVGTVEGAISAINSSVGELQAETTAISENVTAAQTDITAIENQVVDTRADITTLNAKIDQVLLRYPRTISTSAPSGIPREGEEWIIV